MKVSFRPLLFGKGLDEYKGMAVTHFVSEESLQWHYNQFVFCLD